MKIAHVYDEHYRVSPEKGSVAKVIYNIATTQSQEGHDVTVLERQWEDLTRQERQKGVEFTRFPLSVGSDKEGENIPYEQIRSLSGLLTLGLDRFEFAMKLRNHFQNSDYDIIHFHVPFAANILIHIYPKIRDKLIYTAHVGEENIRFGLSKEGLISRLLSVFSPDLHLMRRAAASNVLNKQLAAQLPLDDLMTIPNGVDIEEYSPKNASLIDVETNFGIKAPFILFVGTLTPRKGVDILLDAISILEERSSVNDFDFVLVGNPDIEREFADRLVEQAKKIDVNIHFPGFVSLPELKSLYANAEVFVLPSHEEGMPMVVTEAMASGTPVIASNVSGIPEQVQDGQSGYLVEPGQPRDLADKLQLMITDEDRRKQMSTRSRELAIEKFSWKSVTQNYINLYHSIL